MEGPVGPAVNRSQAGTHRKTDFSVAIKARRGRGSVAISSEVYE